MKKISTGQGLTALFICISLFIPACLQVGKQAAPAEQGQLSGKTSTFSMGGVSLSIAQPNGYVDAPSALRQAASQAFVPPENVFAVYVPAGDKAPGRESGPKLLRDRKIIAVSARPEFTREIVDQPFYRAMQRDIVRVNGKFSSERLVQFKVLTESYYARDDAFIHSLGVYDTGRASVSVARITRQAGSRGAGATSVYPPASPLAGEDVKPALGGWDKTYFSRAYHQVSIQNVIFLNGRCFNIHFLAPLAVEEDLYSAMRENKKYIEALTGRVTQLNPAPGSLGGGGRRAGGG